jgi:predicted transcriptional regulator
MEDDVFDAPRPPPAEWVEALDRGRADAKAGRVSPWAEVRARLLKRISPMKEAVDDSLR